MDIDESREQGFAGETSRYPQVRRIAGEPSDPPARIGKQRQPGMKLPRGVNEIRKPAFLRTGPASGGAGLNTL